MKILYVLQFMIKLFNLSFVCRYLSYVMDVATPTADCLLLIHDLLSPVVVKSNALSHQEVCINFEKESSNVGWLVFVCTDAYACFMHLLLSHGVIGLREIVLKRCILIPV